MASISSRGRELQNYFPVFFDVLDDAWDPDSNPEGFVNLGLAENVSLARNQPGTIMINKQHRH